MYHAACKVEFQSGGLLTTWMLHVGWCGGIDFSVPLVCGGFLQEDATCTKSTSYDSDIPQPYKIRAHEYTATTATAPPNHSTSTAVAWPLHLQLQSPHYTLDHTRYMDTIWSKQPVGPV